VTDTLEILNSTPTGLFLSAFLGLIWGSFFNVCIHRIPSDMPIHKGRSKCPHCSKAIPWYLNIPVLGYLYLNGKTACCKKRLSPQYPLVELGTAITFLALYVEFGFSPQWLVYSVLFGMLWIITVIDIHHRIIPDELSLPGIVVGFLACLWTGDIAWWQSLLGTLFGGGIFFAVAWGYEKYTGREGLGGGDVKLLAMLGAWFGPAAIPLIILVSTGVGSLVGLAWMATSKKNLQAALPFGPFLAAAAGIYLFWGDRLNEWLIFR
jgi:leader peptidase (prepilin peptidase) / N-methyltransferase